MTRVLTTWRWSLTVIARSYGTVLALAALAALWCLAAYEWLGLPESSLWLLILAFMWAMLQLLAAVVTIGGSIAGTAEVAATDARKLPISALWLKDRRDLLSAFVVSLGSLACVLLLGEAFRWLNDHAIEVASYLTWHAEKPVSHLIVERIFFVIEELLWIVLAGFVFSFLISLIRVGWAATRKQMWKLIAGSLYRAPFLTSLLSAIVFGGAAYLLVTWHPQVPAGFWDYAQVAKRISLALVLCVTGGLFWVLSLARLYFPERDSPTS